MAHSIYSSRHNVPLFFIISSWAKLHNIKAISKTLVFLSEKGLGDYEKLSEATKEATDKFDY